MTLLLLFAANAHAVIRYVDNNSPGGNDGLSWATAWDHPMQMTGINPGDTVYISGGASGSSKTYNFSNAWSPPQGNSDTNRVTIANGRDPGHTGQVIFNTTAGAILVGDFLNWITFDFYHENTQKLRFTGSSNNGWYILGWSDADLNDSIGFTILGAIFERSGFVLYQSRKTQVGYCIFNSGEDGWSRVVCGGWRG
jgi:hypothetical protein